MTRHLFQDPAFLQRGYRLPHRRVGNLQEFRRPRNGDVRVDEQIIGCCIAKPGKAILELLLVHQASRGDVQWTLNDSGATGTLVQMLER